MEPFEIMVSESQERMLAVVEPAEVDEVLAVCAQVADAARPRSARSPTADRSGCCATARWSARCRSRRWSTAARSTTSSRRSPGLDLRQPDGRLGDDDGRETCCWRCWRPPNVASKRWAFEQYDSIVGSRTVRRPESADAAVLPIPEADSAIAVAIDGNGRRVACDPYLGTVEAVLECAQNLACVGAEPLGLTNCLNFGNPEKPHAAWQLDRSVTGLADACEALGVPVVGGNVSLYNEGAEGPIYPTPVVGMVGELPDAARGGGWPSPARATRSRSSARSRPRWRGRSWRSCAASSAPGCPAAEIDRGGRGLRRGPRRGPRRQPSPPPTTSATAGSPARSPSRRSAAGSAARIDLDPLVEAARQHPGRRALFGEGPGGLLLSGDRERPGGARGSRRVDVLLIGEAGGEPIEIEAGRADDLGAAGRRRAHLALARHDRLVRLRIAV